MKLSLPVTLLRWLIAAVVVEGSLLVARDASWELVFNDEFTALSFENGTIDWNNKWNKIDYVNYGVADWRKYQSKDDALVTQGESSGTDYVTLKGSYGDYTSQSDQSGANNTFACGGIFTDKTFSFQYGYVEVRARFEHVAGCWPAIWLLPKSSSGWPQSGEIDIMEHINFESKVHQTLHFHNNNASGNAQQTVQTNIDNPTGWHTYGMEWQETGITFYVDGSATGTVSASEFTNWPFSKENHEFYLLIDQQIGGSWVGNTQDSTVLSQDSADFDIDYVRVYSKSKDTATDYVTWGDDGPLDAEGEVIAYTAASIGNGELSQGNHELTITGAVPRLLAEGSHVKLNAEGGSSFDMANAMVQADSLYITGGNYKVSGTSGTLDVDTLILDGGSLVVGSETALSSVKKLYLGMETDVIGEAANRNAALYITANQLVSADVNLINDSKIAVYQGNTLELFGNVTSEGYTLNLVGVDSNGVGVIKFRGAENTLSRVSMGIAETVNGHTFNGVGQVLDVRFAHGSKTAIGELVTNSPNAKTSSLHVENGAELMITKSWKNNSATNAFNVDIAAGGILYIGNGTDAAAAHNLAGVVLKNKGTLQVNKNASLTIDSMSVDASGISSGRAKLVVAGGMEVNTLNINSNQWYAMGTLDVLAGAQVNVGTLNAQSGGQVDINVRDANTTLTIGTLNGTGQALVLNAESNSTGTINVTNKVTTPTSIHVRKGQVNFKGGLQTNGALSVMNDAKVQILSMGAGVQLSSLRIDGSALVGVYKGDTAATESESMVTVTNTMTIGGGVLNADLVLNDGVTLNFSGTKGLEMGSSITFNGNIVLGSSFEELLSSASIGKTYVLAYSMDGFSTDGGAKQWVDGESHYLEDYATAENLTLNRYMLTYRLTDANDVGSGQLEIRVVPEPTSTTLSLLAFAALAARRRRR